MYQQTRLDTSIGSNEPLSRGNGILYATKHGQVVYSPNGIREVDLPTLAANENKTIRRDPKKDDPEEFCSPLWWSEETAFLAFFPLQPRFNREPFNDVFYLPSWIRHTGRRGVSSSNLIGWRRTELKAHGMINCLLFKYDIPKPLEIIGSPICCSGVFEDAAYYKTIVKRSRRWFSLLYAQLSFVIAIALTRDDEHDTVVMPTWYNYLALKAGGDWDVPCLWGIYESAATYMDARERTGAFIDILTPPKYQVAAEWLISFRAPVYYTWGQQEMAAARRSEFVKKHAPPAHMVQDLHTFIMKPPSSPPSLTAVEVVDAFIEERMRRTSDAIRFETDFEAEERLKRELHPPTGRSAVYIWDVDDTGVFGRNLAPKVRNAAILEYYQEIKAAWYNAVFNEWDCWDGPLLTASVSQDHCDPLPDANFHQALLEETSVIKGMAIQNLHELPHGSESTHIKIINLPAIYADYYGFRPSDSLGELQHRSALPILPSTTDSNTVLISALAGKWWNNEIGLDVSDTTWKLLDKFKDAILSMTAKSTDECLALLCDLLPLHPACVGKSQRLNLIRRVFNNEKPWYMLDFGNSATVPWMLAVSSPVDALFLCRFKPHLGDYEICRELLSRGTRFHTLIPQAVVTGSNILMPERKLPRRDCDYKFTLRDYEAYLADRVELLGNPRTQRAALMFGGIIWRLSQTSCSAHTIFEGPSGDRDHSSMKAVFHSPSHTQLSDDFLTAVDMDTICGSYECNTGHGSQVVIRSWWPPTDIWHKYYHYPFWTDTMERTFQHRLSVIATGNAYPLTRKEWKKQLRPQGTTRRFQDKIDELSLRVLDILDKK